MSHYLEHKSDCKSAVSKESWQPSWVKEGREPVDVGGPPVEMLYHLNYLWGNTSAYDVLNLSQNEGLSYVKDLDLCFAGTCCFRNRRTACFPSIAIMIYGFHGNGQEK